MSWSIRVQAGNDTEAVEEAERVAAWIDLPSGMVTLNAAQHRVVGWPY